MKLKQSSKQAYIALGSNMGNAAENLNRAVWALNSVPGVRVMAVSRVYETEPVGYKNQDNFLNAAVRVESELSAHELLGACLGIEAGMGRIRKIKNGPRVIDLDLLLFEDVTETSQNLTLPHPRMEERAFVLSPLLDILNDRYYREIFNTLDKSGIKLSGAALIKP